MQLAGRQREITGQHRRHDGAAAVDDGFDFFLFLAARRMQHEIRHLLGQVQGARMADADAQAQKLGLPSTA